MFNVVDTDLLAKNIHLKFEDKQIFVKSSFGQSFVNIFRQIPL